MEPSEWTGSSDPKPMLSFLNARGSSGALWRFTVRCCQRVEDRLPGRAFREVVSLAEDLAAGSASWEMVDEALAEAGTRLDKLTVKYQEMEEGEEYERLGRKLDAAQTVFVFEYQDSYEAARAISDYFLERAAEVQVEEQLQTDLLREIVPNPLDVPNDEQNEQ